MLTAAALLVAAVVLSPAARLAPLSPTAARTAALRARAALLSEGAGSEPPASSSPTASGTKIAIRVKKPGEGAAKAAEPATTAVDDSTMTITVKAAPKPEVVDAPKVSNLPKRTPAEGRLFEATQAANCTQLLDALLEGANPNIRDPNGRTGLHFMAGIGLAPACVLLIHFGADVNARDNTGLAPIHMAAGYANAQCLRVLLIGGADPTLIGDQGTPLDVVERLGDYQFNEFMNRKGAEKLKKKDDKLEKLKACAEALLDPEKVREKEDWDSMLKEVLALVATF